MTLPPTQFPPSPRLPLAPPGLPTLRCQPPRPVRAPGSAVGRGGHQEDGGAGQSPGPHCHHDLPTRQLQTEGGTRCQECSGETISLPLPQPQSKPQPLTPAQVTDTAVELYHGPVRALCPLAPNNVNTMAAAAVAATGLGFDGTLGRLVADPGGADWHTVQVGTGRCGSGTC